MVGEALTVFHGIKPEPFKVRVVSVVRNFLPKQDVILIRAEDPRVEFSGIAAGMSGSPVYIDGKLIGAIAYAWAFAKEPLAGVTPIETMLAERSRPRRATRSLVEAGELVTGPAPVRGGTAATPATSGGRRTRSGRRCRGSDRRRCPARRPAAGVGAAVDLRASHRALGELSTALEPTAWCRCARAAAAGGNSTLSVGRPARGCPRLARSAWS